MIEWLSKEYTIKVKVGKILLDAFLSSIFISIALYFFLSELSDSTTKILNWVSTEHTEFYCTLILFPAILVMVTALSIATIATGNPKPSNDNKSKK